MQHVQSVFDQRAVYEAPQTELLTITGAIGILTSVTPEGWDSEDYEM